jgi:nitric oxide reductase NorD protein
MAGLRVPELDWELAVYRGLAALRERWFPSAPAHDPNRVARLDDLPSLRVLAQLVAGEPVRLLPARAEGGLRGVDLLVPVAVDWLATPAENAELIRLRVLLAAAMRRLVRERGAAPPDGEVDRQLQACALATEAAAALIDDLPGLEPAWMRARAACADARPPAVCREDLAVEAARWQALGRGGTPGVAGGVRSPPVPLWGPLVRCETEGAGGAPPGEAMRRPTPTTEADAPPVEAVRVVHLDEKEVEDQVLQHTFEKVETLESFNGTVRDLDGADDLEDQLQALDEVELGSLIRGGDEAHSVLRADLGGGEVPDVEDIQPNEQGIAYDEWDAGRGAWRVGWCTVYPSAFPAQDPAWAAAASQRLAPVVAQVLRRLGVERTRRREVGRRVDGDEIDVDAWIDHHAATRVRRTDTARVWLRKERLLRDVSVTLLLDASLSADAWIANRRTLDITRDAAFVVGEIAATLDDPLQLLAFASSTRHRCRVWRLKAFDEPWGASRARLGAVVPQGYTRIGAALRHAVAMARARPEAQRLVVLLTDGRPTDLDRYEGGYGIADVRMALRRAAADGVVVQAIAVDPGARDTLPSMFGAGAWQVVRRPEELAPAVARVYEAARRVR